MYNIKMVAKLLNMPTVTIRAWENRYDAIRPKRSESGHRIYTDDDIEALRWLKRQVDERGLNISQAVELLKQSKQSKQSVFNEAEADELCFAQVKQKLYDILISFNNASANSYLDLLFSMFNYRDVFYQVLMPVLYRIGNEWEEGNISVAQEHYATNLLLHRFFQFFRVFPINPQRPRVLAYCPEGEKHEVGLLLFTLFLREHECDVIYLGGNTPLDGLEKVLAYQDISIVSISIADPASVPLVEKHVQYLSEQAPSLCFVIGGSGVTGYSKVAIPDSIKGFILDGEVEEWEKWLEGI